MIKKKERRECTRYVIKKPCKSQEWEQGIDEIIYDMSNTGCKLHTNIVYDLNDFVGVTINNEYYVGIIVRKIKNGYGIRFITKISEKHGNIKISKIPKSKQKVKRETIRTNKIDIKRIIVN